MAAGECDVTVTNQYYYARLVRSQKPDEREIAQRVGVVFPNQGTWGAHVNISGISGVATKTSYAMFLLHSLFEGGALGMEAANTRSIIFNVKGEDLLFLDRPNNGLDDEQREFTRAIRRSNVACSPW